MCRDRTYGSTVLRMIVVSAGIGRLGGLRFALIAK